MEWLNRNAGALQAIMGIIICFLTAVLVCVTSWYAFLTRRMALSMEHQLVASFQPKLGLELHRFTGSSKPTTENIEGTVAVTNNCNVLVKIVGIAMKVVFDNAAFPEKTISEDAKQRVVAPGETIKFERLTLEVPLGSIKATYKQFAQIHCSDLAGVSRHTFLLSPGSDTSITGHFLGFQSI